MTVSEQEQPWTTKRLLGWINEAFTRKGLESPRLQAEMLVAHVLGCERLRLYMEADRPATPLERQTLRDLVGRALKDEPIDYLVGERWFFGLGFHVSKAVLVPRPSTEAVVEQVLLNVRARMGVGAGSAGMMGVGNDEPATAGYTTLRGTTPEHESLTAACRHVGGLLGVSPETLRVWQRRYDIDTGVRPGVTSDMAEENRRLRRENAELKKANEVLKAASVFFAKELDRPRTK